MKTHSGDITFTPAGTGFELTASTFSGDDPLQSAAECLAQGQTGLHAPAADRADHGRRRRRAFVDLSTFSGDITVRKGQ